MFVCLVQQSLFLLMVRNSAEELQYLVYWGWNRILGMYGEFVMWLFINKWGPEKTCGGQSHFASLHYFFPIPESPPILSLYPLSSSPFLPTVNLFLFLYSPPSVFSSCPAPGSLSLGKVCLNCMVPATMAGPVVQVRQNPQGLPRLCHSPHIHLHTLFLLSLL